MRFMCMVKSREDCGAAPQSLMEAMGEATDEAIRGGAQIETGGLAPTAMSRRVRLEGGQVRVLDGPFSEAKEVVGGYAILEVASQAEAVEQSVWLMNLHKEHWPGWEGEVEVRQIFGAEDFPPRAVEGSAGAGAVVV
jgi:hypothetical protein